MLKKFNKVAAAIAIIAGLVSTVQAAPFANGGFEDYPFNSSYLELHVGDSRLSPWEITKGSVDLIGNMWAPAEGKLSLDLIGRDTKVGEISQTFDTIPNKTYLVQFKMSGHVNTNDAIKVIDVSVKNSNIDSLHYEYDVVKNKITANNMKWASHSFLFTAQSNSATLIFAGSVKSGAVTSFGPALDDVTVTEFDSSTGWCPCNK